LLSIELRACWLFLEGLVSVLQKNKNSESSSRNILVYPKEVVTGMTERRQGLAYACDL
jgi:hypothetical protein